MLPLRLQRILVDYGTANFFYQLFRGRNFFKAFAFSQVCSSFARKTVDAAALFLYGSCARGTVTVDSDIDIAVVVDEIPGDYQNTVAMLWKLTRSMDNAIEPVLLTAQDDASGLLQTVQRTGIAVKTQTVTQTTRGADGGIGVERFGKQPLPQ